MPLRPLVTLPLFPGGMESMEQQETPQGGMPLHPPVLPPPPGDNDDPFDGPLGTIEEEPVTEHTNSTWTVEAYEMDDGGGSGDDDIEWKFWDSDAPGSKDGLVTEDLTFLGQPARFASYDAVAGFMRLAAVEEEASPPAAGAGHEHDGDGDYGVIDVHFRHSRMRLPRPRGSNAIEYPSFATTDVQRFRYLVPFATVGAEPVNSLRLAGASLASDLYPYSSFLQLQAVWWGLVAAAPPVRVPPGATRLVVTVDVGVLRGEADDLTPENMERMRSILVEKARDADGSTARSGEEQLLPAPVVCRDDDDDVAGGGDEVCAICREGLEEGCRVAWPRCCHVFHGKCLERLLTTVRRLCPLCRSTLSVKGMFVDDDPRWPTS